jgi:hypothetical protein
MSIGSLALRSVVAASIGALMVTPAIARHGYLRIHHHHWEGVCSAFSHHPCTPTVCSVFHRGPCMPEIEYPIGEDLQLTVVTAAADAKSGDASGNAAFRSGEPKTSTSTSKKLNTIRDVFNALRACWTPPPKNEARPNMQMSVRFSFKNDGELIGVPRITYKSPDASPQAINDYSDAITASLKRCTPLPLSDSLGNAIAGRPISVRFVDNRRKQ